MPVFRFLLPTGRRDNPQIRLPPPKETVLVTLFVVDSHMTPVWITGVEIPIYAHQLFASRSQETAPIVIALEQRRLGHEELSLKIGLGPLEADLLWGPLDSTPGWATLGPSPQSAKNPHLTQ